MRKIAVSQRVDRLQHRQECRDALDQRWAPLLESIGLTAVPLPNGLSDPQDWALQLGIDGLILSGGNDVTTVPARDQSEKLMLELAIKKMLPVLGICRGLQMINIFLGGSLRRVTSHAAIRHPIYRTEKTTRFLNRMPQSTEVNSFHEFGIAQINLADQLIAVMQDTDGNIEAAEHTYLPWVGLMWHPEREEKTTLYENELMARLFNK